MILSTLTLSAYAVENCDVQAGSSVGIRVVEFISGNTILSKMPMHESSPSALSEELTNLQDMGLCGDKIKAQKCVLKLEKRGKVNGLTLLRGASRWNSWNLKSKVQAQNYVKDLKRLGFCS